MKNISLYLIIGTIVLGIVFAIYPPDTIKFNITDILPSIENVSGKSEISNYRIDVSDGKSEIEKTAIIKYNNLISVLETFMNGSLEDVEERKRECFKIINDFIYYLRENEVEVI